MGAPLPELVEQRSSSVAFAPRVRAVSATFELFSPEGTRKASGTGNLDTTDTTVSAVGTSLDVVTLGSASGVRVGDEYWYVSLDGWAVPVRVGSVAGAVVTLDGPLPGRAQVGDAFKGLTFRATIGAIAGRGTAFRLTWTLTDGDGLVDVVSERVAVVRSRFADPVSPADAARLAGDVSGSWARQQSAGRWRIIADRACSRVRAELVAQQDYPHLQYNTRAFLPAGEAAIRLELAHMGIVPTGTTDTTAFKVYLQDQVEKETRTGVAASWNDRNDDGFVDSNETLSRNEIVIERV